MDASNGWSSLPAATDERFRHALSRDHDAVLAPDASTPFRSAADAAARLLPYHVFAAPGPYEAGMVDTAELTGVLGTRVPSLVQAQTLKRRRSASFPSPHQSIALWIRYTSLWERYRKGLVHTDGGPTRAQAMAPMQVQLAHLSVEHERECLARDMTALSARRGEYESWVRSNPRLRPTYPAPAPLKTVYLPTAPTAVSVPLPPADVAAAASPVPKLPGKKRGRKSKSELAAGLAALPSSSTNRNNVTPAGADRGPLAHLFGTGTGHTTAGTIPKVSVVQIPLAWLTRLTQAGINPVPAPHLVPILSAAQAQSAVQAGTQTAPRPPSPDQKDAAVLVGMTQVVPPTAPTSPPVQILHVSIRWDKLSSAQLSTVVGLLRSIRQVNTPMSRDRPVQPPTVSTPGATAPQLPNTTPGSAQDKSV